MNKEKQKKRNKKYESLNGTYKVDQKKRAVIYFIVSKGEVITGVAKCNEGEVFDLELGRQIAYRRAHYNQRDRDLFLLRMFIDGMKVSIDAFKDANLLYSKHYEIALMNACEEEKSQLEQMRTLECEINELIEYKRVLTKQERAEKKLGRELTHQELSELETYGVILTDKMRARIKAQQRREQEKKSKERKPGVHVEE